MSSDLKYGPCPPARDFGSRVSGLVFIKHCSSPFFINFPVCVLLGMKKEMDGRSSFFIWMISAELPIFFIFLFHFFAIATALKSVFLVASYATLYPAVSVGWSVGTLSTLAFLKVLSSLSYPNGPVTFSFTAPAHPHATRIAAYPALFNLNLVLC